MMSTRPTDPPTPEQGVRWLAWVGRETALFLLSLIFAGFPDMRPSWWGGAKGRKPS